ncbi:MAG: AraC family transcriptional regulator [Clostridia bacterium]|nr:AraC family transcriptional regulator [Clostridia bacterium]
MKKYLIGDHEFALKEFHVLEGKNTPRVYTSHFHDFYQIMFVSKGTLRHSRCGIIEELNANDAILLPPLMEHHIDGEQGWAPYYAVSFKLPFLPLEVLSGITGEYLQSKRNQTAEQIHKITFSEEDAKRITAMLKVMLRELRERQIFYTATLQGMLVSLLVDVMRAEWKADEFSFNEGFEEKRKRILSFTAQMREQLKKTMSSEEAARECAMSRAQFCKAFQEVTGTSYGKYRNSLRMDYAAKLLNENRYTLEYIAQECGFKEYSSFYRSFVNTLGVSPTDYRKLRIDRRAPQDE